MGENKLTRLCHIIKRDDFDGYGFNLHAEKGKPGQYIGKVDDNSPAEAAGLKQGDRIIEVNAVNIGNETHKQVVQRIKAIADEVRLLVVDPTVVSVSNNNQVIDSCVTTANNVSNEMPMPEVTITVAPTTDTMPENDQENDDDSNANDVNDAPAATVAVASETPTAAIITATNGRNGQSPNSNQTNDSHAHSPTTNTTSSTTTATGNSIIPFQRFIPSSH